MTDKASLVWCGAIDELSGYADECRGMLAALDEIGVPVALRPAGAQNPRFRAQLDPETQRALSRQQRRALAPPLVLVQHYLADGFAVADGFARQIGRTMFETDSLPAQWVAQCNRMDEIWVPSRFNEDSFARAGVQVPIHRIPGGVDVRLFTPGVEPLRLPTVRGSVFLGVFEWSTRKGWDVLLRAWAEAFSAADDATLVLRSRVGTRAQQAGYPPVDEQIDGYFKEVLRRNRGDAAPIMVLDSPVKPGHLPALYASARALVVPTRGEGWGRPFMEAMACGVPVITTRWSAHLDYMNDGNSLLVDIDGLVPATEDVLNVYGGQRWAEPRWQQVAEHFRFVYEQPIAAAAIGAQARSDMVGSWTWQHAARTIAARLAEIDRLGSASVPTAPSSKSAPSRTPAPAADTPRESEHHLFVLWEHGRDIEQRMLADLATRFEIVSATEICWSAAKVAENYTRFYGQHLPPGSFKQEHCGSGPLLAIIVRDHAPHYGTRETSRGPRRVNTHTFDAKQQYREWTGGGHRVHATDTVSEARHDVALLLGEPLTYHVSRQSTRWNGAYARREADLVGSTGWSSLEQLFDILGECTPYVVMRNFDTLPHQHDAREHGDIDLLVESLDEARFVINANPVFPEAYRVHFQANVAGVLVPLDLRYAGDGYYPERWQRSLLARSERTAAGLSVPSDEDHFYTLLYHALIHKPAVPADYADRLCDMAEARGLRLTDRSARFDLRRAKRVLDAFLAEHGFSYTRSNDHSVYHNALLLRVSPAAVVESRCLDRLPLLHPREALRSARELAVHEAMAYDSIVYQDDDTIVKQATGRLAWRDGIMLQAVQGPGVPRVLGMVREDGWSVVRLENVHGEALQQALPDLAHTPARLATFFKACLDILEQLQRAGVRHRDIHAGNLLVRDGAPVLIDFGWAATAADPGITPEWLGIDSRPHNGVHCDVYSMGRLFATCQPAGEHCFDPLIAAMVAEDAGRRCIDIPRLRALMGEMVLPARWTQAAPRHADEEALLGQCVRWQRADYAALALRALEQAIELRPHAVPFRLAYADALRTAGHASAAMQGVRETVSLDPQHSTARDALVRHLLAAEQYADAVDHALELVTLRPFDPEAHLLLAVCRRVSGESEPALASLRAALAIDPYHPDARAMQAAVLPAVGQHDALPEIEEAATGSYSLAVSIIVPVHNQSEYTMRCIEALDRTLPTHIACEVIVVDDASTDNTAELLAGAVGQYSWLRVVSQATNTGFSGACNAGARAARGKRLVFLNNDTTPQPEWLSAMLSVHDAEPDVGVVGSLLLFPPEQAGADEPLLVQHAGVIFRDDLSSSHIYKFCYADLPFVRRTREYQAVTGACLLISHAMFFEVGGFDTGYRNGGEDLDLCFRVRARGQRVMLAAESVVWHHESVSLKTRHHAGDANYRRFLSRWREQIHADENDWYVADGLSSGEKPRLAILSPLPPTRTGVADVSRELTALLARYYEVDLFTDHVVPSAPELVQHHRVHAVRDYAVAAQLYRYDAAIFHIGNNSLHSAIAKVAGSTAGIVVLHEYDARGAGNGQSSRPFLQSLLRNAKAVVVHNTHSQHVLREEFPSLPVHVIPLTLPPAEHAERPQGEARERLRIDPDAFVVLSLGLVQYHKRNHVTLEAFARFAVDRPDARLLLAGESYEPAYGAALLDRARELGVADRVAITGWVSDDEFFDYLSASDVTVNLRYPSRGEESATLARILGSGRPACVSRYAQYAELPSDTVVHIDFAEETDQLCARLGELYDNPERRRTLGQAARRYMRELAAPERIVAAYRHVIASVQPVGTPDRAAPGGARTFDTTEALVHWAAPLADAANPLRQLALEVDRLGIPGFAALTQAGPSVDKSATPLLNAVDARQLSRLGDKRLADNHVQVYAGSPCQFQRNDRAKVAVAYVASAAAEPLAAWAKAAFDEYWVPSVFGREQLRRAGVPGQRITVVPAAIQGFNYRTNVHENRPQGPFRFLAFTDWSPRSGWEPLLRAFLRVRQTHPSCQLLWHAKHDGQSMDERNARFAEAFTSFMLAHPEFAPDDYLNVLYDAQSFSEDYMPLAYASGHALVSAHLGATSGRTVLEAMAVGLPVVVPSHGAYVEFANEDNALLVPVEMLEGEPAVSEAGLLQRMLEAVSQRSASSVRGIVARQEVLASRSAVTVARVVAERLRHLLTREEAVDSTAGRTPASMAGAS